ncbi:retrovirus-related Pol polyprotein from transposon opus [Trichonephila clavata]|uniref:Retrovirus-related Pol polyprotein from transposon opus n=1 Tax=Trichonephila clavata TaxID=2740835 RepID=A0A8X6FXQ5_TRICU|nr:retrovirus-related Pol polyprotein from transposon opus [Trichonephila clavata]
MSRTIDVAAVQKDSVGVDQLLSKKATLDVQIASLKLRRKFRSPSPHHHQNRGRRSSRRCYNPQSSFGYYHSDSGRNASLQMRTASMSRETRPSSRSLSEGSRPLPEKIEAITSYNLPATIQDRRTFLGIINFYWRYLKDAAKTQATLYELMKGAKKKEHRKVPWTDDTRRSFVKSKIDLAEAALLSFLRSGLPLSLCTDALDFL